jgi:UDP-glucose 4-epimerase
MRVLVTGAAGLAGRTIARQLADQGFDVVAQWRYSPPHLNHPRIKTWQADLSKIDVLPDGVTGLVHCAARSPATGGPMPAVGDMVRDNVVSAQRLADLVSGISDMRVVHLSSSSVHGHITADRLTPETPVVDPDLYGETKRLAERIIATSATAVVSLRLPAIIGPGATRNWAVSVLSKLRAGLTVRIFNPDRPFNNVIHADDIASFAAHYFEASDPRGGEFPIGSASSVTVRGVVQTLASEIRVSPSIEVASEVRHSFTIDFSAAAELGFMPMKTEDALRQYAREEIMR